MHRSHTEVYIHFSWATRNRARSISPLWEGRLHEFLRRKCAELRSPAVNVNGTEDHVHVLLRASALLSVAKLAHDLKGASSYMLNDERLCSTDFAWQDGYAAFSVSPQEIPAVSRYIDQQKRHHSQGITKPEWDLGPDDGCADPAT